MVSLTAMLVQLYLTLDQLMFNSMNVSHLRRHWIA